MDSECRSRFPYSSTLRESIRRNLAAHDRRQVEAGEDRRRGAVAVVLVEANPATSVAVADPDSEPEPGMGRLGEGTSFLLCRRAASLRSHAGQWALPGGRVDDGETVVEAALRELDEEVGVVLDESAVIGRLDDYPTRSGYVVSPVVMWAGGPVAAAPNPAEVQAAYCIGLTELCREDSPRYVDIPESDLPVVQMPLGSLLLHAPAAAVMLQLRWVGLEGRLGQRVDHLEQPVFAWR